MRKAEQAELLLTLARRFREHPERHPGVPWPEILARLERSSSALKALHFMELSGGEPDVVSSDAGEGELWFFDCSSESPTGRRSLCYDQAGLESRREHKPAGSAVETAASVGLRLLSEREYRVLQEVGEFDGKTSSWLATPADVRSQGGALFGDRRYGRVFVYHNGAQSYYAARGFRAALEL